MLPLSISSSAYEGESIISQSGENATTRYVIHFGFDRDSVAACPWIAENKVIKKTVPLARKEYLEQSWVVENLPKGGTGDGFGVRHHTLDLRVIFPSSMNDFPAHTVTVSCLLEDVSCGLRIIAAEKETYALAELEGSLPGIVRAEERLKGNPEEGISVIDWIPGYIVNPAHIARSASQTGFFRRMVERTT